MLTSHLHYWGKRASRNISELSLVKRIHPTVCLLLLGKFAANDENRFVMIMIIIPLRDPLTSLP
jgi:hypothetical protein